MEARNQAGASSSAPASPRERMSSAPRTRFRPEPKLRMEVDVKNDPAAFAKRVLNENETSEVYLSGIDQRIQAARVRRLAIQPRPHMSLTLPRTSSHMSVSGSWSEGKLLPKRTSATDPFLVASVAGMLTDAKKERARIQQYEFQEALRAEREAEAAAAAQQRAKEAEAARYRQKQQEKSDSLRAEVAAQQQRRAARHAEQLSSLFQRSQTWQQELAATGASSRTCRSHERTQRAISARTAREVATAQMEASRAEELRARSAKEEAAVAQRQRILAEQQAMQAQRNQERLELTLLRAASVRDATEAHFTQKAIRKDLVAEQAQAWKMAQLDQCSRAHRCERSSRSARVAELAAINAGGKAQWEAAKDAKALAMAQALEARERARVMQEREHQKQCAAMIRAKSLASELELKALNSKRMPMSHSTVTF